MAKAQTNESAEIEIAPRNLTLVCIENSPVAVWHTNWHRDWLFQIFCKKARFYRTISPTNRTFGFRALFYMFCWENLTAGYQLEKKLVISFECRPFVSDY